MLSNHARLLSLLGWLGLVISLVLWLGWTGIAVAMTEFVVSQTPFLILPALLSSMALFCGCLLFVRLRTREINAG